MIILKEWIEYYPEEVDEDGGVYPERELFCIRVQMARPEYNTAIKVLGQQPFTVVHHAWNCETQCWDIPEADILEFEWKTESWEEFGKLGGVVARCNGYVEWHKREHQRKLAKIGKQQIVLWGLMPLQF